MYRHRYWQRRWRTAELRAQSLVVTPIAEAAAPRPPVAGLRRPLDRRPQRHDLAFGGAQVGLVRHGPQYLAVAEVHQLEQSRDASGQPPHNERVEPHLEQRLALEDLRRGAPGLVVDHAHVTAGGLVEAVDVAAQSQSRGQRRLDVVLPLYRLEPGRVLEVEVTGEQLPRGVQPVTDSARLSGDELRKLGLGLQQGQPLRLDQVDGCG